MTSTARLLLSLESITDEALSMLSVLNEAPAYHQEIAGK
jgi:hypothetical protein